MDVSAHIHEAVSIDSISGGMCRAPLRWVKVPSPRRKLKSTAARPRSATPHGGWSPLFEPVARDVAAVRRSRNLHVIAKLSAPGANSSTLRRWGRHAWPHGHGMSSRVNWLPPGFLDSKEEATLVAGGSSWCRRLIRRSSGAVPWSWRARGVSRSRS